MSVQYADRTRSAAPILTLVAGALFLVVPLLVEFVSGDFFAAIGLAGLLLLAALPGLRRIQDGADGRAGAWGLRLIGVGLIVLVLLVVSGDALDAMLDGSAQAVAEALFVGLGGVSMLALLGGIVAFSVGMTRAAVFPKPAIWIFLGGMVVFLGTEAFEQSLSGTVPWLADVLPPLGFMVAGAGLVMLGRAALRLNR